MAREVSRGRALGRMDARVSGVPPSAAHLTAARMRAALAGLAAAVLAAISGRLARRQRRARFRRAASRRAPPARSSCRCASRASCSRRWSAQRLRCRAPRCSRRCAIRWRAPTSSASRAARPWPPSGALAFLPASALGDALVPVVAFAGAAGASALVYRLVARARPHRAVHAVARGGDLQHVRGVVHSADQRGGGLVALAFHRVLAHGRHRDPARTGCSRSSASLSRPAAPFSCAEAPALNLLALGDESAEQLGVDLVACRRRVFVASALLVGTVVSLTGVITFGGLDRAARAQACARQRQPAAGARVDARGRRVPRAVRRGREYSSPRPRSCPSGRSRR